MSTTIPVKPGSAMLSPADGERIAKALRDRIDLREALTECVVYLIAEAEREGFECHALRQARRILARTA